MLPTLTRLYCNFFVDRLQSEANALRDEIDKNELLEHVKTELELEKSKLEHTAIELKNELNLLRELVMLLL